MGPAARAIVGLALLAACAPPPTEPPVEVSDTARALYDPAGRFYDAPFPAPWRARADGTIDVADFPTRDNLLAQRYVDMLGQRAEGYGRNSGFWFPLSGPIDPQTLPKSPQASASFGASVFLVNVDERSAAYGHFIPLEVRFKSTSETYSPANLLVGVPRQGFVLAPDAWYVAALTTALHDTQGRPLPAAEMLNDPSERGAQLQPALQTLRALMTNAGFSPTTLVAATAFSTGNHAPRLAAIATAARQYQGAVTQPTRIGSYSGFAAFRLSVDVPLYQTGTKPYLEDGAMHFDGGVPLQVGQESVRVIITLPRQPMPSGGFPLVFHAVGSGADATEMVGSFSPGAGLARELGRRGIATWCADPNLTGARHPSGETTGLSFFNPYTPVAVRDNHRQQVAEFEVFAAVAAQLRLPGAMLPEAGAAELRFDVGRFMFHGHSTGSVVGAQILAANADLRAGVLTGAGGSWLYNFTLKQATSSAEVAAQLLGYRAGDTVDLFDPVLHLASIAWDPIEPMNQAALWTGTGTRPRPTSVLLIDGLADTYYLPRMQAALAQAAGGDFVGASLEPEVVAAVALGGGSVVAPPMSMNRGTTTQAVVQYAPPSMSDGHFVVYDVPAAKLQYGCFFETARDGAPRVVAPVANADAPCQ